MRKLNEAVAVSLVTATAALGLPQAAPAQFVTSTSVTVNCLTGTAASCSYMAFLLETTPNMAVQSFQIIDALNTNPLEFSTAGVQIFEGMNSAGTNVTGQYAFTLGASGVNVNRLLAQDATAPYPGSPLYFLVNAAVAGSLDPLTYQMLLPEATNTSGKSFTGDVEITSTVSEPISLVLLGTGLIGVGAIRRRRRRGGDYIA